MENILYYGDKGFGKLVDYSKKIKWIPSPQSLANSVFGSHFNMNEKYDLEHEEGFAIKFYLLFEQSILLL